MNNAMLGAMKMPIPAKHDGWRYQVDNGKFDRLSCP